MTGISLRIFFKRHYTLRIHINTKNKIYDEKTWRKNSWIQQSKTTTKSILLHSTTNSEFLP